MTTALKAGTYAFTGSVGLLPDAIELSVNLVAAMVAFIALTTVDRPADQSRESGQLSPFFSDPFSCQFFGDQFTPQQQIPREETEHSLGSGVAASSNGNVLTNYHLIDGAGEIEGAQ